MSIFKKLSIVLYSVHLGHDCAVYVVTLRYNITAQSQQLWTERDWPIAFWHK